ncbi:MAG: hypothetical protein AAGD43_08265 [Pseudomonadota bacterium]
MFHILSFDQGGKIVVRRKIKRMALVGIFEKLPRCMIGLEACISAHFVSRTLHSPGFEPRVIPAKCTKQFEVKRAA